MVHEPGEPEQAPAVNLTDLSELTVDLDALRDFIAYLRAEIDKNLAPYSNEIINTQWSGYAIAGFSASAPLAAFVADYYKALGTAADGLTSYLESAEIIARALEILAKHYRGAEVMAQGRLGDVNAAMNLAGQQLIDEKKAFPQTPV